VCKCGIKCNLHSLALQVYELQTTLISSFSNNINILSDNIINKPVNETGAIYPHILQGPHQPASKSSLPAGGLSIIVLHELNVSTVLTKKFFQSSLPGFDESIRDYLLSLRNDRIVVMIGTVSSQCEYSNS